MKDRYGVLALLISLFAITYLDRVCISVAGPRMQHDLDISPVGWGWVTAMFTISYCAFGIPSGVLGDRLGPRRVLTLLVLAWSAFTALTGMVSNFVLLLAARLLFGASQSGAFPNASVVVSRWFPPSQRATVSGVNLMASQIGGGLAPLLVVPIQIRYGWRASFYVFAALGVLWAAVWYIWFRDSPGETHATKPAPAPPFPWTLALSNSSILATMGCGFCYAYAYNFFQTWFHTFLVKGRNFSEGTLLLSSLPYVLAAITNLSGGAVSDALVARLGPERGRRALGITALTAAGLFTLAAMASRKPLPTILFLTLVYGAITFQQSGVFGACLDMGQKYAGAIVGLMNTAAQVGGLLGSVLYGYIVERSGSYDAPFLPMASFLFLGAGLWLKIDASQQLTPPAGQVTNLPPAP